MSERYNIPLYIDPSPDSDFSHFEVYRAPELPIIAVTQTPRTFTIEGRFESWYNIGDELEVSLSTGNDGTYTIASISEATGNTVITVTQAIPSAVADGLIKQTLLQQLAIKSSASSFEDKGLPAGFYYYVIYAVDKNDQYSDPSNIIIKSAPESTTPPAMPTGLRIRRSDDLLQMELSWNPNTEEDLKGYLIYRSFDGVTYDIVAIQGATSNGYKDDNIPSKMDTDSNTTPVLYAVSAINKSYLESTPAGPTTPLEVPILTGLRAIIDYLSVNVYWDYNKPEDGITGYDIYIRAIGSPTWTLAGSVDHPQIGYTIEGPLIKNTTYEIGIVIQPYTGATAYIQPLPVPVTIPNYETDTTRPTSPEFLEADMDPENNRMFISWRRIKVDDDFLHYALWIGKLFDIVGVNQGTKTFTINTHAQDFFSAGEYLQVTDSTTGNNGIYTIISVTIVGVQTMLEVHQPIPSPLANGMLFQLLLDGITTQNNWTLRNMRRYFAREDTPINRAFVMAVTAFDRSGNQSLLGSTAYLREYWASQDMFGPTWIDFIRTINSGLFKEPNGTDMAITPYAQYYLQWNDISRMAKKFRRYVIFETIRLDPAVAWGSPAVNGVPLFDFDDDTQIRGFTTDNTFQIHNNNLARGFRTTDANRYILYVHQVSKIFGVIGNQVGNFRIGDTLTVYGSSGNAGTYTISAVSYSLPNTYITVTGAIPSPTIGDYCYDTELDKSKWYAVLTEDWFGDRVAASPFPYWRVK